MRTFANRKVVADSSHFNENNTRLAYTIGSAGESIL